MNELSSLIQELRMENEALRSNRTLEPHVSLPNKYDGSRGACRSFISQVKLIFELQPLRFPNDRVKVGFIGTLLTGTAASWFSPLFETDSPLLEDLNLFICEFERTFGDFDRATVAANKLHSLSQGLTSASEYAATFRQISCDLQWGEDALIDIFRRGLREEVKDLLLTLPYPKSLNEAITYAVNCDNRLMERRMERRSRLKWRIPENSNNIPSSVVPMELDSARERTSTSRRKLTQEESDRRRRENLCLYCGEPGHVIRTCSKRIAGNARVRPY